MYHFFKPLMTVLKSIPTVAFVFVFVVMSNAKDAPVYVVLIICFPILYEAVVGGFKSVDKDIIEAQRSIEDTLAAAWAWEKKLAQ